MRAASVKDLAGSQRDGRWPTVGRNREFLNSAFDACEQMQLVGTIGKVIVFFTADGTNEFQGVAEMTSRVEPLGDDAGELGVSWKRTTAVPFAMIAGLVNPLNGTPVVQSPDCAELATPVGMQLTHIVCNAPPREQRAPREAELSSRGPRRSA